MRTYKVVLMPVAEDSIDPQGGANLILNYKADDFKLEYEGDGDNLVLHYNFIVIPPDDRDEDSYSVGAVPFGNVRYIQVIA